MCVGSTQSMGLWVTMRVGARRLRKVGWIFTQSNKAREFIISGEEAAQMAGVQAEMGESAVTAVVSMAPSEDGGSEAHFEAFQVRDPLANCHHGRRWSSGTQASHRAMWTRDLSDMQPCLWFSGQWAGSWWGFQQLLE